MTASSTRPRSGWWPWLGGGLLLALTVAAAVVWWYHTHTRIEQTLDLPPQGEAAYNPLYLLQQTLREDGLLAQSRRRLQLDTVVLGQNDTLIFIGDPRLISEHEAQRLLAWAQRGGHLIVRVPSPRQLSAGGARRVGSLLERLGVSLTPDPAWFCHELHMPGDLPEWTLCADVHFALDAVQPEAALWDPSEGFAFARLIQGHGTVDVWAHLDFLNNIQLRQPQRAAFTRQLLAPNYGRGMVHLIYGTQMPALWQLVLEYGRMAWLPLLLALGTWLWMRMSRFGPLRPSPSPSRRALLEHIEASGEYLYREGHAGALHAAMRAAFLTRLHRRAPLAATLQGDALHAVIAAHTGLAAADIAEALHEHPAHAADFQRKVARLLQMMRTLNAARTV